MDAASIEQEKPDESYIGQLTRHRHAWEAKPAVRTLYRHWYAQVVAALADMTPTVEIGCGCGNFKEFYPAAIATDVIPTPWCEKVADACDMPFGDESVGNLVVLDVLHHIPSPLDFFEEAIRVLLPGGRIVLLEPYITLWSRFIYGCFHHEPVDPGVDFFDPSHNFSTTQSSQYSNSATASILFDKYRARFAARFPLLKLIISKPFSFLAYPLTGGFAGFRAIPAPTVVPLSKLEDALLGPIHSYVTAMRILVVLEKTR